MGQQSSVVAGDSSQPELLLQRLEELERQKTEVKQALLGQ